MQVKPVGTAAWEKAALDREGNGLGCLHPGAVLPPSAVCLLPLQWDSLPLAERREESSRGLSPSSVNTTS